MPRAGLLVGLHSRHGSERGDQQTQQKQHIHPVPLLCQRGPIWWIGRRSSAYMASILALISAVLMPPLRRTGGRGTGATLRLPLCARN
nr:hypothetical protein JVH1_4764 [Rhodococcus sp. JVH1]